jgi:hypothetical protein
MDCPYCGIGAGYIVSMNSQAASGVNRRYQCKTCGNRWTTVDGKFQDDLEADVTWQVRAHQGCEVCLHYKAGYCSLGIPEAHEAGFVTECVARVEAKVACVVQ